MKPIKIDIEQGTKEWLELRRGGIGASEASIILGINPWKTPCKLWRQKLDGTQDEVNEAMQKGKDLEHVARDLFNAQLNYNCQPAVYRHGGIPYMLASLDGYDEECKAACEIKCGGHKLFEQAMMRIIPEYYMSQMQHTMEVMDLRWMYYVVYFDGVIEVMKVDRYPELIKEIILKEAAFWTNVVELTPPEITEADYVFIESPVFIECKEHYANILKREEQILKEKAEMRERLISFTDGLSCEGPGIKIRKCEDSVTYDYKKYCEDKGISLDELSKYKKKRAGSWRIILDKE